MTYRLVAKLCHSGDCCPEIRIDETVDPSVQVMIADDFGSEVYMSIYQLGELVRQVKDGELDPATVDQ